MIVLDPVGKEIGFSNFNHFCLVNNELFVSATTRNKLGNLLQGTLASLQRSVAFGVLQIV